MPRSARAKSESGIYHVMLRGINRQSIFSDEEDSEKFIQVLSECQDVSGYEIYAYCLMGNHVHLLMKVNDEPLEQIFKRIGARYVFYYNWKYKRSGHLFQDRYKSEPVENDSYLLTVVRYIHQNPVKAKIVKELDKYRWSSYNDYMSKSGITNSEFIYKIFNEDEQKAKEQFKQYNNIENDDICLENNYNDRISDQELIATIQKKLNINAMMIQAEPRVKMIKILEKALNIRGASTRQLARVTGISANIIWQISKSK